jgi:hypothetical protein
MSVYVYHVPMSVQRLQELSVICVFYALMIVLLHLRFLLECAIALALTLVPKRLSSHCTLTYHHPHPLFPRSVYGKAHRKRHFCPSRFRQPLTSSISSSPAFSSLSFSTDPPPVYRISTEQSRLQHNFEPHYSPLFHLLSRGRSTDCTRLLQSDRIPVTELYQGWSLP